MSKPPINYGPTKNCTRCDTVQPIEEFHRQGRYRRSWCRTCVKVYFVEYREKNGDRLKAWGRDYTAKNRSRRAAYLVRRKFGLTQAQVATLITHQGAACPICGVSLDSDMRTPIDHDHTTGLVRGVLCSQCNLGLGLFADDPARLQAAIEYLSSPPAAAVGLDVEVPAA